MNARGQIPSVEVGQKIAKALGVSVEYLVTGKETKEPEEIHNTCNEVRLIARLAEQLDDEKRKFVIDFIKWLKNRR